MTFGEFVLDYQPQATWFYQLPQSELLAPVRLDAVVRFDELEEDLCRLPPISATARASGALELFPCLNKTFHPPWQELYTPRLAGAIAHRWGADLDLS